MKNVILSLLGITIIATIATVGLLLIGYPTIAAIIGTSTVALWLFLFAISIVSITAWWTRQTMTEGANIALRAQTVNDAWDAQKTSAFANLAKTMLRLNDQRPALPMPQQDWLPQLHEIVDGETYERA